MQAFAQLIIRRCYTDRHNHKVFEGGFMKKTILGYVAMVCGVVVSLFSATAFAAPTVLYSNIPTPVPSNISSYGVEAYSMPELGGQVQLAGLPTGNVSVQVLVSSWGCEMGRWYTNDCATTQGTGFAHPITLNVYAVNADNSVGTKIATSTKTFTIPYRPSASPTQCNNDNGAGNAGKWWDGTECKNGLAVPITFDAFTPSAPAWPSKMILGVAYNTSTQGYSPVGTATACYASNPGCGYDSLNVGISNTPATVGSAPLPNDAYVNSSSSGMYCSGEAGTFRLDSGCWDGWQPMFEVRSSAFPVGPPTAQDQCKKDGWKVFTGPTFKNQGQCVAYVVSSESSKHHRAVVLPGVRF
jgi:hypothetical protein